jgi:signal transduction histidine kinase
MPHMKFVTQLTAIIGEAELALDKDRTVKEYQESLSNILSEADRLNGLINNLLQLSAVGYNPSEQKRNRISLTKLLHEAVSQYGHINPDHRIRIMVDENDDLEVRGNDTLLQIAIINVLDNASKFSFNKEVLVTLACVRDQILVTIKDEGVGIPEADIPKIRQPFFRSENVRSTRGAGIGVPLAIKIIEMHGGRVHVASDLGKGTTVTLSIPSDSITDI